MKQDQNLICIEFADIFIDIFFRLGYSQFSFCGKRSEEDICKYVVKFYTQANGLSPAEGACETNKNFNHELLGSEHNDYIMYVNSHKHLKARWN